MHKNGIALLSACELSAEQCGRLRLSILANPRYTGRQAWNRQRTDADLVDPANTGLGHRQVQRWNLPAGWVISARPAHPALVSEADYIAAQGASAPRGPAGVGVPDIVTAAVQCGNIRTAVPDQQAGCAVEQSTSLVAGQAAESQPSREPPLVLLSRSLASGVTIDS